MEDVKPHASDGVARSGVEKRKGGEKQWRHLGRKRQRSESKQKQRVLRYVSGVRERKGEADRGDGTRKRRRKGGGRPGIDRLKKGWIFLPLGGGPA